MKYYVGIGRDDKVEREDSVIGDNIVHARAKAHDLLQEGEKIIELREWSNEINA